MSDTEPPLSGTETCLCGAQIHLMVYSPSELRRLLEAFREGHAVCREGQPLSEAELLQATNERSV